MDILRDALALIGVAYLVATAIGFVIVWMVKPGLGESIYHSKPPDIWTKEWSD